MRRRGGWGTEHEKSRQVGVGGWGGYAHSLRGPVSGGGIRVAALVERSHRARTRTDRLAHVLVRQKVLVQEKGPRCEPTVPAPLAASTGRGGCHVNAVHYNVRHGHELLVAQSGVYLARYPPAAARGGEVDAGRLHPLAEDGVGAQHHLVPGVLPGGGADAVMCV